VINKDKCSSFFDNNHQTPEFISNQKKHAQQNRRHFLKSAGGMGALASLPAFSVSAKAQIPLSELIKTEPWLTLDATLNQLLPSSPTGPSATEIKATAYLYQVMTVQPTAPDEKEFILKGVGWLNGYAKSEKSANFAQLNVADKEQLLRGISRSAAGKNWLNTLLGYIFQAMLSPASYGGNPDGIGWQWLEHQAGFPLPVKGQRYFELPTRARIDLISRVGNINIRVNSDNKPLAAPPKKSAQGTKKA
jgi:gluconate 2-dehydrogenase gamma chain